MPQVLIHGRGRLERNADLAGMVVRSVGIVDDGGTEFGGEKADSHDFGLEFRYNTAGKGSLQVTANWVEIRFEGAVNSALGNEMLSGLRPGTNGTWRVSLQRNLSGNLQVDLTYNGRRSEGAPVIHVGGAQVRAFF